MADLAKMADELVNLSVKDVNELAQILKDEHGIEPAAAAAVDPFMKRKTHLRNWPEFVESPVQAKETV